MQSRKNRRDIEMYFYVDDVRLKLCGIIKEKEGWINWILRDWIWKEMQQKKRTPCLDLHLWRHKRFWFKLDCFLFFYVLWSIFWSEIIQIIICISKLERRIRKQATVLRHNFNMGERPSWVFKFNVLALKN